MHLLISASPLAAEPNEAAAEIPIEKSLEQLVQLDGALDAARASEPDCEAGCITPSEAARMAFEAGEGQSRSGRFILDIRSGGQSLNGSLEQLYFVNSRRDYAQFGTLTIAIEPDALYHLLRRARVCGARDFEPGQIDVKACRQNVNFDVNMFTMMQRLADRRIVVDGEVQLQWIDARTGTPRPVANIRGENERGYYQVWVRVDNADQVTFVYDD